MSPHFERRGVIMVNQIGDPDFAGRVDLMGTEDGGLIKYKRIVVNRFGGPADA